MTVVDRAHRSGACAAARRSEAQAALASVPAAHQRVLASALRAPSAHNAQPWRIRLQPGPRYELHYDHHEYLPADPQDRDAYLSLSRKGLAAGSRTLAGGRSWVVAVSIRADAGGRPSAAEAVDV